jgi:hypothetical protein
MERALKLRRTLGSYVRAAHVSQPVTLHSSAEQLGLSSRPIGRPIFAPSPTVRSPFGCSHIRGFSILSPGRTDEL